MFILYFSQNTLFAVQKGFKVFIILEHFHWENLYQRPSCFLNCRQTDVLPYKKSHQESGCQRDLNRINNQIDFHVEHYHVIKERHDYITELPHEIFYAHVSHEYVLKILPKDDLLRQFMKLLRLNTSFKILEHLSNSTSQPNIPQVDDAIQERCAFLSQIIFQLLSHIIIQFCDVHFIT